MIVMYKEQFSNLNPIVRPRSLIITVYNRDHGLRYHIDMLNTITIDFAGYKKCLLCGITSMINHQTLCDTYSFKSSHFDNSITQRIIGSVQLNICQYCNDMCKAYHKVKTRKDPFSKLIVSKGMAVDMIIQENKYVINKISSYGRMQTSYFKYGFYKHMSWIINKHKLLYDKHRIKMLLIKHLLDWKLCDDLYDPIFDTYVSTLFIKLRLV